MSRLELSRDSGFSSKIGSILPKRLETLQEFFFWGGGVRGHASLEKNQNLRSSNCWKCIEIVCSIITAHPSPPAYGPGVFSLLANAEKNVFFKTSLPVFSQGRKTGNINCRVFFKYLKNTLSISLYISYSFLQTSSIFVLCKNNAFVEKRC